jgi:drug/metabolite transporter (DMT)-like permease
MGLAWGLTIPMTKIAVSTGHEHFGLIFWQMILVAGVAAVVSLFQRPKQKPARRHLPLLLVVALAGSVIPNSFFYIAAPHLPGGVMSIVMSMVPMSALPIAVLWGNEVFVWRRFTGLFFGALAMIVLIGPDLILPEPSAWIFVLFIVFSTIFYGFEGNYVARFGLGGLDAVQTLMWSSILGVGLVFPLAIGTGQFYNPMASWSIADTALVLSSVLHGLAYAGYIWLVGRAGPVFATQISYLVTLFGVISAMVILGERYSGFIWLSLGMVMFGVFLVQPRQATQDRA